MGYIHPTEYYLATKRNYVLIYATTWMNLDNIMLRGKPDTENHMYDSIYMEHPEEANP